VTESSQPPLDERQELFRSAMLGAEAERLRMRRFFAMLPSNPRCKACNSPFGMPGSIVAGAMGRRQWAKNPKFCNRCYTFLRDNGMTGVEIPVSVLFADVRDSTTLAEQVGPAEFRARINRFYRIASEALIHTDGLVDKFVGDGVLGLYIPGLTGPDHAAKAVEGARRILARTQREPGDPERLPIGVGVHTGPAFVGAVGEKGEIEDFTALGDAVNATARLASVAPAGEALVSVATAEEAKLDTTGLERRHLEVKGRTQPIDVVVLRAG
jgi:adenylate cyclase